MCQGENAGDRIRTEELAMTLKEGAAAPAFALATDEGTTVKLSDFQGHHVVLFFFPKAMTPG